MTPFGRKQKPGLARAHFFPLGGVNQTAAFIDHSGTVRPDARAANA